MRLFTGLALPPDVSAALTTIAGPLRAFPEIKVTPVEKLHITTAFIGEWPESRLASVVEALKPVRSPAVEIRLRGLGWLPNPRFPRALYAGVQSTPDLPALAAETARVLAAVGVKLEDRIYRPHVTLARVRGRLKATVGIHADPIANFQASSFFLYLSADGKYTKLQEFSFLQT